MTNRQDADHEKHRSADRQHDSKHSTVETGLNQSVLKFAHSGFVPHENILNGHIIKNVIQQAGKYASGRASGSWPISTTAP